MTLKDEEQAMLNEVNAGKGWIRTNKVWLIAIVVAFVLGFIVSKVV